MFHTTLKRAFQITFDQQAAHVWLLLLRVSLASFILVHGLPKLWKLMAGGEIQFSDPLGVGTMVSIVLAVFAEVVCSICILFGLGTRVAAIPLIITMAVAAFIVHANDLFGKKELALLYLLGYVSLLIFGSGKYSFDSLISKRFSNS